MTIFPTDFCPSVRNSEKRQETDGIEQELLAKKLGLKLNDLQREIATLRHMEKLRATMKGDKKVFCLW
ncbi:MAG: hypothetical protein EOL88_13050 [Bacteroidia bacterium]|nr:hypothetical protein [Bacteroidia bacterium]